MLDRVKSLFSSKARDAQLQERLDQLRQKVPVPVFWLLGKTQSGKTTLVKFLTAAEEAEIGHGFKPCTRFSQQYQFPTAEAPLMTFVDTRGLDEPGYDPADDLAAFNDQAHLVVVTVKALDHAQENVLGPLRTIRKAKPDRPVLLVLTCLHEGYPQQQHPRAYPYGTPAEATDVPEDLRRTLDEQKRRFEGLVDRVVPIDVTKPEEGFEQPQYGGEALKAAMLEVLPAGYRQTLLTLDEATKELKDIYARHALPYIAGYSALAAAAGAIPVPLLDLVLLPGVQTQMIYHLANYYGQPMTATRFVELASTLGLGMLVRQGTRMAAAELLKFIPILGTALGTVAGSALAATTTFALGKAFCYYYSAVHQGHVPKPEELRKYYKTQLSIAEQAWSHLRKKAQAEPARGADATPLPAAQPNVPPTTA
jgi:uncharacterized protein (DUF697 family)/predicted GTPase